MGSVTESIEDPLEAGALGLEFVQQFFDRKSPIPLTRLIASLLERHGVRCVVSGGVAFAVHGLRTVTTTDIEAIRVLKLPREFGLQLNPEARQRFEKFWDEFGGPAGMEKARDHACLS